MNNEQSISNGTSEVSKNCESKQICLFCFSPILVANQAEGEPTDDFVKRKNVLVALCFHLHASIDCSLANQCVKDKFPFCDECDKLLEHFGEYQEIMETAKRRISKILNMIEHKVVEGEIIGKDLDKNSEAVNKPFEDLKLKKLREIILEGYRNKLLMKQQLRDKFVLEKQVRHLEPRFSHLTIMKDKGLNHQFQTSTSSSNIGSYSSIDNLSMNADHEYDAGVEPSNSENLTPLQIKQEMLTAYSEDSSDDTDDYDNEDNSSDENSETDQDIMELAVQKRRLMLKGVEIYRCAGTTPNHQFFHCSICNFKVPCGKNNSNKDSKVTPLKQVKMHVQEMHFDQLHDPIQSKRCERKLYQCLICNTTFTTRSSLQKHKSIHPIQETLECDVCGRIMKTQSQFHLLLHKFSHKNDQERKTAIAAGESGIYTPLLCAKLRNHFMRKQNASNSSNDSMKPYKSGGKLNRKKTISTPVNCSVCKKEFPRKCYLSRHMKIHNSSYKRKMRKQIYSKTSSLSNLIGILHKRKPKPVKASGIYDQENSNGGLARLTRISNRRNENRLLKARFMKREIDYPPAPILERMVDFDE
ncbi:unnamed protein product [Orchesella dallaii]|uniref:C2H2-type domain-containing protein n=1 Tax=Orchesella dallaii TaxID=48710 RepID=A0ABP1PS89_9HEXA